MFYCISQFALGKEEEGLLRCHNCGAITQKNAKKLQTTFYCPCKEENEEDDWLYCRNVVKIKIKSFCFKFVWDEFRRISSAVLSWIALATSCSKISKKFWVAPKFLKSCPKLIEFYKKLLKSCSLCKINWWQEWQPFLRFLRHAASEIHSLM